MSRVHLSLLLLLLVAGSAWLAWRQPALREPPATPDGQVPPDYYLRTLTLRDYTADGALQRVLRADTLEHVPGAGTDLARPRLTLHTARGAPWTITADAGHLDPDGELLRLPGEVEISRLATPYNRPVRLQTRDLRYRRAAGYVETDAAVTVTSARDRIDAVGLRGWLQEPGKLKFLSEVRAHYEP